MCRRYEKSYGALYAAMEKILSFPPWLQDTVRTVFSYCKRSNPGRRWEGLETSLTADPIPPGVPIKWVTGSPRFHPTVGWARGLFYRRKALTPDRISCDTAHSLLLLSTPTCIVSSHAIMNGETSASNGLKFRKFLPVALILVRV